MFLFRLMDFGLRIIGALFLVFFLQIRVDGKTLENHLNDFGKKFIVTKTLQKVSQDGAKAIKSLYSGDEKSKKDRNISHSQKADYIKELSKRIKMPSREAGDEQK